MLQALQMEQAMFFTEHWHVPEQEHHLPWMQRIPQLDDQISVDCNGQPGVSRSNAIDIPATLLDPASLLDRMASVSPVSGYRRSSPIDFRLSRSAPADLLSYRMQRLGVPSRISLTTEPQESNGSARGHTPAGLGCVHDCGSPNDTGRSASPSCFGRIAPPCHDCSQSFETPVCQASIDASGFPPPPTLHVPWNCTDWAFTDIIPPAKNNTSLIEQHGQLQDLQLNAHSTSSPNTGELTMSSPLASEMLASDMSCQTSAVCSTLQRGAVDVMPFDSNLSNVSDYPPVSSCGEFLPYFPCPLHSNAPASQAFSMESDSSRCVASSFHFVSEDSSSLPAFPSSVFSRSRTGHENVVEDCDANLVNGVNNDVRNCTEARERQLRQDASAYPSRPIAPKGKNGTVVAAQALSSPESCNPRTRDGKRKLAITKTSYSRPKQPKKQCDQCNEHPEGFRGEHELRRHMERAHTAVRKMWVCIDFEGKGFLDNCKKCRNGKKYGAYYNAAAHLRRAHFNKRQRGRNRTKSTEKRGGMGGGDQPAMEYLKQWMAEVEDVPDNSMSDSPSSDEDMQGQDTIGLSPSELFDFDRRQLPGELTCNLITTPQQMQFCQQPLNTCQTTSYGHDSTRYLKAQQHAPDPRVMTGKQEPSTYRHQPSFAARPSFSSRCQHPSIMPHSVYSPAFDDEFFPVLQ